MRVGVWCGVAVTLLIVATNAARTVQTEGVSRTNRRITTTERNVNNLNKNEENIPTSRPRSIRRREQTQESSTIRSRTRGRTLEYENISPKIETEVQSGQNGSFESRKSSTRSRSRIIGKETTTEKILSRESIIRGRSRGSGRKYTSTTSAQNDQIENLLNNVPATFKPRSVEFKANEILPTVETAPTNQFRRRSSTVSSVDDRKQIKPRGRVNTRINSRALDLEVAGTTNTFTEADKQTTNTRIIDGRNSRKLRYKSRTVETDTNLTGEGLTTLNTVETSSQGSDIPSQPELSVLNSTIFTPTDNTFQPSTESVLTSSTLKAMKIVRRPITRSNGYLKSSDVKSNSKMSDEISEDDNYPETFKALIQAKNATQADSPIDESFSVKESHKVTKTHALSVQSNTTDPVIDKNSRLRKKLQKEKSEKNQIEDSSSLTSTTTTSEAPKPRSIPFRPRSTYLARGKKLNVTKSTTENINYATRTGVDNPYKFSKRTKSSTEPSKTDITLKTKRVDTLPKKQIMRSSLFSRKNDPVDKNISVIPLNENRKHDRVQSGSHFKTRRTLPSTTYYSRLRNNTKLYSTENSFIEKNTETPIADKKVENSADMPLIFTYLNRAGKKENLQSTNENNATATTRSLNGKESQENSTENEIVNKAEESENKFINTDATTQKYHANYKENMQSEKAVSSATPVIRNIKTRKYARKQEKTSRDQAATTTPPVIFKSKERNVRKYSDSENFSKTTESPANSISQEPEKPKHKFSSKYRGSYLDRPIYKPTVPTVTPSTNAWEKFFVTDEYTEFVEEPILFGIEFSNNTTEMISRMNFTSPTYTHESSIELVEGEEIQLGPDMNAIAITKTHRPLSSADLRLSESLAKPLQVLNVEASHHSPSVTVSIFDALAEILTSTPKPRISTTTEILPKNTNEIDIMHSLDGVSSNVNVNTVTGFASPDTVTSKDNLNTNAKFVQTTEQVVFNSLLVGDNVTPSLNADEDKTSFVTSPKTVPTPTPTTPVSARKPFAIKVLYSETESTNQNSPTAMPSTTATSTDKSTMVYNSISDLLQSNNGLVSSGLTSMLSNNIRSIIDSMDDETKSRLSVGMTNLLNTLTPSGINNVPKVEDDNTPYMTTPYSLEDIKDTENIDINFNDSSNIYNILQNDSTAENIVNSTVTLLSSQNEVATESPIPVNISQSLNNVQNLESESGSDIILENNIIVTTSKHTESTTAGLIFVNSNTENLDETFTNEQPITSSTVPFKTQAEIPNTQLQSLSDSELLSFNQLYDSGELQDINQVSQLQLWILSKKARVLKMIEDILRKHSEEISNPPLSVLNLNKPNISLSNRLTEIINTMNLTTIEPDSTEQTTFNLIESNSYSTPTVPLTSTISLENNINDVDSDVTTQNANDFTMTNDQSSTDTISRIADAFTTANSVHTTTVSENISTISNFEDEENESSNLLSTTTTNNLETTTEMAKARIEFDTTTKTNLEETTTSGIESLTTTVINDSKSADFTTTRNMLNVLTRPSIPKKDFVIFGILPNNTVVRKDPNDNPLEALTEASPYIIYGVLPNNTIIRKFPNGTRVPQIMQKIDVLPISPWSLKNPYSPIHNIPAIVRPQSNPIRVSTNTVISTDIPNNEKEISLTTDTVNNLQVMIPTSTLNLKDSSSLGITTTSTQPPAEKSTASHVLSLRTTTTLPSVDEILLNSISLATKEEMVISSMTSSTPEPRILTLDIDPETKQIRTEKPIDGTGNTVFKFIPIEDVTVPYTQETNVLKLASPKNMRVTTALNSQTATMSGTTEVNTQTPQIQINTESTTVTTTIEPSIGTSFESNSEKVNDEPPTPVFMNEFQPTTESQKFTVTDLNNDRTTFRSEQTTVPSTTGTFIPELQVNSIGFTNSNQNEITTATTPTTDRVPTATSVPIGSATNTVFQTQTNPLPLYNERNPKNIPGFNIAQNQQLENAKLLQALLMATSENKNSNNNLITKTQSTTVRSIEDDIRQFEEDTKLLKALLQATGRDPASLNLPSLDDIKAVITTLKPSVETTTIQTTPSTVQVTQPTTENIVTTITTSTINENIKRLQEDTQLLQALLQATGNKNRVDMPVISGLTSNVRIASNPLTTSMETKSTTAFNVRPVYTTTQLPPTTTVKSQIITVSTLQPTTEDIGISTTFRPVNIRTQSTSTYLPTVTTEIPSSSTYSDEEDLLFLKNLKSVLSTKAKNEDPETSLANRVIALAVERSLNEIQVGKSVGTTKVMTTTTPTPRPTTTTTKTTTTTTTRATTTPRQNTPSIEDDIKQFEQDTKLLQALLKATGQDPSKFNIPTLPTTTVSAQLPQNINDDLTLLSNLLATPSPLNEPFDPLTQKPAERQTTQRTPTTTVPHGIQIAVKDDLKNEQDDVKLLQTLIKLQDAQETTTMRSKLAITGHSSDEALKKLIQKTQPSGMMSDSTKPSMSLSTEYGNSNDALLAALLKEQGFGPTTASSLDEQIRLAALLNQVVVTPKARRTTTPPPPPPAPRRPILDGLSWLWQQWRDTAPGSQGPRQSRPAPTRNQPAQSASATSSRVNWFGSGPFVGNADERPANRIPLEPPSAVEQPPGRGQLVSAAINVTRAFSQFLGAAIQGAAQTVQNVFRAGQKVASDAYTTGSGGSG